MTPKEIDSLAEHVAFDGLKVSSKGEFEHCCLIEGWIVRGQIRIGDDGPVLASLELRPEDSETDARVTSKLLRSVPVAELLSAIRDRLLYVEGGRKFLYQRHGHDVAPEPWPRTATATRRDDPRKQALLRRVAVAYLDEIKRGVGVYGRLVRRFRGKYTPDQLKALVRAARSDGWLTTATHGSRGADPGPRLLEDEESTNKKGEQ